MCGVTWRQMLVVGVVTVLLYAAYRECGGEPIRVYPRMNWAPWRLDAGAKP